MVRNAQEVTNFGGIRGLRGLDDVKLYNISPPISEERWEPSGARNIEAVVLHTRGHLEFGQQTEYNEDFIHGELEYVDRLNDNPSEYNTDPRRRTPIDFAPWGMHYFIARNGDIYKCMNEYDIAYGVEMKHIVGARESRIVGGRMKSKDLKGLDEGGFTDTSSEGESETDEEGRVLNAGYYVYYSNGEFRKGDSFNFVRPSGLLPVIGVESNGNNPDRRYVIMGRDIVALERDDNSGKVDSSRSATIPTGDNDVVALSVTNEYLFIYNKSARCKNGSASLTLLKINQ